MDWGQLEKGVKFIKFFVHIVIPLFLIGSQKSSKHFDVLFWS